MRDLVAAGVQKISQVGHGGLQYDLPGADHAFRVPGADSGAADRGRDRGGDGRRFMEAQGRPFSERYGPDETDQLEILFSRLGIPGLEEADDKGRGAPHAELDQL